MTDHRFDAFNPDEVCPTCGRQAWQHSEYMSEDEPAPATPPALPLVTAETHGWPLLLQHVLTRDGRCIFAITGRIRIGAAVLESPFLDHFCRDRYRDRIDWYRHPNILTLHGRGAVELDHVKLEPMSSRKAPDSEAHLVVACYGAHHGGLATSHDGREFEREWLSTLYPQVWATFLERRAQPASEPGPEAATMPAADS